jgi:hypothetical protein
MASGEMAPIGFSIDLRKRSRKMPRQKGNVFATPEATEGEWELLRR